MASDLLICPKDKKEEEDEGEEEEEEGEKEEDEPSYEFRDARWRVQLLEAIPGHHLDVLFGESVLDPVAVAARDDVFSRE